MCLARFPIWREYAQSRAALVQQRPRAGARRTINTTVGTESQIRHLDRKDRDAHDNLQEALSAPMAIDMLRWMAESNSGIG